MMPKPLELLAPARDLETGRVAIDCGADAVYIGPESFGARAAAGNSTADIAALAEYAHRLGARVYATMNTILRDDELARAEALARSLAEIGVDALIVQDMAYTTMNLPIALHASTQCDIRTPQKAAMLAAAGFTRLVLPREFTPEQVAAARREAGVPVEVFIHGARCVSYSGDCQMGYAATGRSANRGMCPQMCRLPFELTDDKGNVVAPARHYLSLSDMATADFAPLVDAGAVSFKIEGRLKDRRYVANAVAWYSAKLNEFISASGGKFVRSSFGTSDPGFKPDISKGFFRRPNGGGKEACLASPNDTGTPVGKVTRAFNRRTRAFSINPTAALANGDGLGYFDGRTGEFKGFRLNRIVGNAAYPAQAIEGLDAGIVLFRTSDRLFAEAIDKATPQRRVRVDFNLAIDGSGALKLSATAENGSTATATVPGPFDQARTSQQQNRLSQLARIGDTHYSLGEVTDSLGDVFVPASILADCRRRVLESLTAAIAADHCRETPGMCTLKADAYSTMPALTYHDNVANAAAAAFYTAHGSAIAETAAETRPPEATHGCRVMSTRYCIRRELGACLKTPQATLLPPKLYLRNPSGSYRIEFDCHRCGMNIIKES